MAYDSGQVGLELKLARIRKGLKQWQLAQWLGVCQNTLSLIELGRRQPSAELLEKIEKALSEAKGTSSKP